MIKKSLTILMLFTCVQANAGKQLMTYNEIVNAVSDLGVKLKVVMNIKQCQHDYPIDIDATGYVIPDAVMAVKGKYVTFAMVHFTANEPRFIGKPVYETSKYRLMPDGTLTIDSTVYDAVNFNPLADNTHMTCKLNDGVKFLSLS